MQIPAGIFSKTPTIKILLQNPTKFLQIYFKYIIQENLLQYLSQ